MTREHLGRGVRREECPQGGLQPTLPSQETSAPSSDPERVPACGAERFSLTGFSPRRFPAVSALPMRRRVHTSDLHQENHQVKKRREEQLRPDRASKSRRTLLSLLGAGLRAPFSKGRCWQQQWVRNLASCLAEQEPASRVTLANNTPFAGPVCWPSLTS